MNLRRAFHWILGIEKNSGTPWTSNEDMDIICLNELTTDKELGMKHKRTPQSVRQRRYVLKKRADDKF